MVRKADNLSTFMCRPSWESGSLNLLEPSAPVQGCNGIALHFLQSYVIKCAIYIYIYIYIYIERERVHIFLLTYLLTYSTVQSPS